MVNFPDLPQVPQWLKDILGDTSPSGNRGLWAGSHMMASGTNHFDPVYAAANRGLAPNDPRYLTDQSKFNGVWQLSGTVSSKTRVGANPPPASQSNAID